MYEEMLMKERFAQGQAMMAGTSNLQNTAGLSNQLTQEKRQPEMAIALTTLQERIESLERLHENLNGRLNAILRSEPDTVDKLPSEFSGVTPLTNQIATATNRIQALIYRTRTMLDLLEL